MKKYIWLCIPLKAGLAFTTFFSFTVAHKQANAQWSYDTVSFEMPTTEIVINPASGFLWQIGKPQKVFFSNSHSGTKAILTDTLNNYPSNDTSSFIYIIRNPYTQTCETCMEFWHKYDMDSVADKGIIDASYDGGNSWLLVNDTVIGSWLSWFSWNGDYHTSTGNYTVHQLTTSGKSDGWIQSSFCWQWWLPVKTDTIIPMPDSLMIRFTFISDSTIKNKEGWMIDDIVTSSAGQQDCSGIKENTNKEKVSISPNPFSSSTTLHIEKEFINATLTVYNSYGQTVKQINNISGKEITLQRDNLPSGLYFIRLTSPLSSGRGAGGEAATEKIIITD